MEVGLELGPGGDPVDDSFRDEVRFDGGYPVAFDAFYVVQAFEKFQETFSGSPAEVSCVDSGYDYLLDA